MTVREIKIVTKNRINFKYLQMSGCFFILLILLSFVCFLQFSTTLVFYYKNSDVDFFVSKNTSFIAFKAISALFGFLLTYPLISGSVFWIIQNVTAPTSKTDFLATVTDFYLLRRSFLIYLTVTCLKFAFIIPIFALFAGSYAFFYLAENANHTELFLMLAINFAFFGGFLLVKLVKFSLSLVALPLLFTESPSASPFKLIRKSVKLMQEHKLEFLKVVLSYWYLVILSIPVITLPLTLPKIIVATTVFLENISTKPQLLNVSKAY
jgi:hypothetical protein